MSDLPKKSRGRPKKIISDGEIKKAYRLIVTIGDLHIDVETDDPASSILEIKPVKILQRVYVTLSKDGKSASKMVFPVKARMIFGKRMATEFFIKRLLVSMK